MFKTQNLQQQINWTCSAFKQLSVEQLYDVLKLRSDVFVVEQACIYADLDNKDKHPQAFHLLAYKNNELLAYARLLGPNISFENVSFGRVVVKQAYRDKGLGQLLLKQVLVKCNKLWPAQTIDIGAQQYLYDFYARAGFTAISSVYLEDGIEHLDMRLTRTNDN